MACDTTEGALLPALEPPWEPGLDPPGDPAWDGFTEVCGEVRRGLIRLDSARLSPDSSSASLADTSFRMCWSQYGT